jgi:outer membrane protein assembly factor BamB
VTTPTVWATPLPAPAGELAAGPDGCAAAGAGFVALARATGELAWSVPTEPGLRRGLAVLPDGRVADVEGDHVVIRGPGGEVTARWDGRGVTALAPTPDGDLVHVVWSPDEGTSLVKTAPDGTRRGRVPLAGRSFHPPLVTRDLYVVTEDGRVRGLDHAGRTQWTATRDGLSEGIPPTPATGAVREPVLELRDGRFAVEFAEEVGYAFHAVDPTAGTVTRLAPNAAPPRGTIPAGSGVVALAEPDQHRNTTLRYLTPDGTPAWTWHPPGPLTATPTPGDGVLYAAADSQLFGLSL